MQKDPMKQRETTQGTKNTTSFSFGPAILGPQGAEKFTIAANPRDRSNLCCMRSNGNLNLQSLKQ